MITRADIVAIARGWIDTPYVHQATCKGAGCDCIGLIRGVWREAIGPEPEIIGPYTPEWAEEQGRETLLETARRHFTEVDRGNFDAGDVLIFRWAPKYPAKHAAIASSRLTIIHAYQNHAVQEVELPRDWRRKIAAAFRFPGVA